jgi:hypothetical protein
VEASPLVDVLKEIIELNDEEKVIEVIHGKAEEIDLENGIKVDIIISEWMGFYFLSVARIHVGLSDSSQRKASCRGWSNVALTCQDTGCSCADG